VDRAQRTEHRKYHRQREKGEREKEKGKEDGGVGTPSRSQRETRQEARGSCCLEGGWRARRKNKREKRKRDGGTENNA